jgi:PiT family inorganic phosphate transporter
VTNSILGGEIRVKKTLDKDLTRVVRLEQATHESGRRLVTLGLALLFLALAGALSAQQTALLDQGFLIIVAGVIGGYMALNIGANDVANNVGPAVGARALTMVGALIIAAIFETAGAVIAGGDVVSTIKKGIIDPSLVPDTQVFVWTMMSALLAAALWINVATYVSAPVSTTHSIVGGVMGAGIAAVGFGVVNWGTMAKIAASWVISPVMGGMIAAMFLAFIKIKIVYQEDKIAAAKRWVPVLVALMAGVFSAYLVMKGLKKVWKAEVWMVVAIGIAVCAGTYALLKPLIARRAEGMENRNKSVRTLFVIPLICSAALLSFAHGSNDVANAIGPLAAIVGGITTGDIATKVGIPFWVMLIGAAGISLGLFLFGPKLIRTVGQEITRMNPMRAYCVALSAAITVIIASALGLPVSSTHIAVGGVFGVGFFREYFTSRRPRPGPKWKTEAERAANATPANGGNNNKRRRLVRRAHLLNIIAAWVITVPATALIAGGLFQLMSAFFGA